MELIQPSSSAFAPSGWLEDDQVHDWINFHLNPRLMKLLPADNQPQTLAGLCLNVVLAHIVEILLFTPVRECSLIGIGLSSAPKRQFFKLQSLFQKHPGPVQAIVTPAHLIRRIIHGFARLIGKGDSSYGPNDIPLLLYLSILSNYKHHHQNELFGFPHQHNIGDQNTTWLIPSSH